MPINITQVGGFVPQTNIQLSYPGNNILLSNIKIERKELGSEYVTILITDSGNNMFNYTDINEFGKTYSYRVSCDVLQKRTIANTVVNKQNYWKNNYILSDNMRIDTSGKLYATGSGTGYATANANYLKKINAVGYTLLDLSAWIGNGGDKAGKYNAANNNIIFRFRSGTTTTVDRLIYFTKAWTNTAYKGARKYWMYINKRGMDGKRVQIKLFKDTQDGFDIKLGAKTKATGKESERYNYSLDGKMLSLVGNGSGFGYKGGKATMFRIELKNGARISPDFGESVTTSMTENVLISTMRTEETFTIKDEPDVDYGIIINEKGEGFRFNRYEPNGLLDSDDYETKSASQMLDIQDSRYPLVYINDNKKTPSTNFTILTDNLPFRNRMRNRVVESNYIYIYVPKSWNYQLINGFYAYETVSEERIRYSSDLYCFHFNSARRVLSNMSAPPKWTYDLLKDSEVNYVTIMDNYRDYADLAISPTGTEVLGEKEGTEDEIL